MKSFRTITNLIFFNYEDYTILLVRIIDDFASAKYYPFSIFDSRGIAQSGSAPALGAGCRGFKSLYPDQIQQALVAQLDRAPAF